MKKINLLPLVYTTVLALILSSQLAFSDQKHIDMEGNIDAVPNFHYVDLDGNEHTFKEHRGKWVLVNYWATYCSPCLAEIPDIDRFVKDNPKNFVALGIDAGGSSAAEVKAFAKRLNVHYPLITAQEEALLAFGLVEAIPTSYIISPEGKVVKKYVGIITYIDLDAYVNKKRGSK